MTAGATTASSTYTGEGQVGDQQMTQGNRTIRDHADEGRELHLFEADGRELEYIGEFQYHDDYQADAPEVGNGDGALRKVIVFRLAGIRGSADRGPSRTRLDRFGQERTKEVPVEQFLTERMVVDGERAPYEAERREQKLVWHSRTILRSLVTRPVDGSSVQMARPPLSF